MKKVMVAGLAVGLLAGCMGSDSDSELSASTGSTDASVAGASSTLDGDWRSPCVALDDHGFGQLTLSFNGEGQAEQVNQLFSSARCSGDVQDEMVLDVRFEVGEAVELASGETAYRIEYVERELRDDEAFFPPGGDVYAVRGDRLYFGDPKEQDTANDDLPPELNSDFVFERL